MNIESLQEKYSISSSEINKITTLMLENKSIDCLHKELGEKFTKEQIFVIASSISRCVFEAPVDEICPQLALDRIVMNENKYGRLTYEKMAHRELKKLKMINEDLMLLKFELKNKAA